MNLLFLNWRDLKNPRSGGAEVVTEEVAKRLVLRGHRLTLVTTFFPGAQREEMRDGYRIIRRGGEKLGVHLWVFLLWWTKLRKEHFDIVVDQIHGIPFMTPLYARGVRKVAFIHEVAREIWLRMFPFPIGRIGYTLEKFFFLPYRKTPFLTVSEATKRDLESVGISPRHIAIIPEAITLTPIARSEDAQKETRPTIIFVGRVAKMKGVSDLIAAYALAKKTIPNLALWIVGGGDEYKKKLEQENKDDADITFFGFVSEEKKAELLRCAHILSSASVKEGFGLVVIEAAASGTPSVVYRVDGFTEAVKDGETGILTDTSPEALAKELVSLLEDKDRYTTLQKNALEHSRSFTFDHTADVFESLLLRLKR